MIKFDSHVHTEYCGHAEGMSIAAIVARANELELESLLIVEHIFKPQDVEILEKIRNELRKQKSRCHIIVGGEVDVDPMKTDGSFVASNGLIADADLVMGAVHYVPTVGNYPHCPQDNPLEPEKLLELWKSSLLGMLENPSVDILAHPARLPSAAIDLNIYFDDVLAVLALAAEMSVKNNICWEINNLTCARLSEPIMDIWYKTIQTAIDAGVKITYGSDAHSPLEIGKQGYVQKMLSKFKNFKGLYSPADILKEKNESKK